ncbi:MAG: GNAT family protein [bacterium]
MDKSGKYVRLSKLTKEDKKVIKRWNLDSEVSKFRESATEEPNILNSISFGIYEKEKSELIGDLGISSIDKKNKHAEIGLSIGDKRYWGRGYGTDSVLTALSFCFEELCLNRVYLDVWEDNKRAIRCYESCGFMRDGLLREHVYRNGKYHNKLLMSILKSDWEKGNKTLVFK